MLQAEPVTFLSGGLESISLALLSSQQAREAGVYLRRSLHRRSHPGTPPCGIPQQKTALGHEAPGSGADGSRKHRRRRRLKFDQSPGVKSKKPHRLVAVALKSEQRTREEGKPPVVFEEGHRGEK